MGVLGGAKGFIKAISVEPGAAAAAFCCMRTRAWVFFSPLLLHGLFLEEKAEQRKYLSCDTVKIITIVRHIIIILSLIIIIIIVTIAILIVIVNIIIITVTTTTATTITSLLLVLSLLPLLSLRLLFLQLPLLLFLS